MSFRLTRNDAWRVDDDDRLHLFRVATDCRDSSRPINEEEFDFLQRQIPHIQAIVDRVLGKGMVQIEVGLHQDEKEFRLRAPTSMNHEKGPLRELFGFICVCTLDDTFVNPRNPADHDVMFTSRRGTS